MNNIVDIIKILKLKILLIGKKSYSRDDVREDDFLQLETILNNYKLHPNDREKVHKIINKYKKRIPTRR